AEDPQPVGVGPEGLPHLLSVDDPLVAVEGGPRPHGTEVGAGVGLAEALAPELLHPKDGRQEAQLLLLAPELEEHGPEQVVALDAHPVRGAGSGLLELEDDLLVQGPAPATVRLRPGDAQPTAGGQLLLPCQAQVPVGVVGRSPDAEVLGEDTDQVLGQPGPRLLAELLLLGCEPEVHMIKLSHYIEDQEKRDGGAREQSAVQKG